METLFKNVRMRLHENVIKKVKYFDQADDSLVNFCSEERFLTCYLEWQQCPAVA